MTPNPDTIREFLEALWPLDIPEGEDLVISWAGPGEKVRSVSVQTVDEAIGIAERATDCHVWLNIATRDRNRPAASPRGRAEDCRTLPAIWADLDVIEGAPPGAHKDGAKAFPTYDDAEAFVRAFPIAPTMTVRTGYGYSAWWILDEPVDNTTGTLLIAALAATMNRLSAGQADPSVFDIARMMRVPGTLNWKNPDQPIPATIEHHSTAARYSVDDLLERLDPPTQPARTTNRQRTPQTVAEDGGRPGDHYSAEMDTEAVAQLLTAHGCTEVERTIRDGRTVIMLARPGKDPKAGHSMSVGWAGEGITYMFSSGWDLVPAGTHPPFRLYTLLEHAGDYAAAARALRHLGYGDNPTEPLHRPLPAITDADLGEAFTLEHAGELIHVSGIGWMAWDGNRWVEVTENRLLVRLATYVKRLIATIDTVEMPDDRRKQLHKAANAYLNTNARSRVLRDAAGRVEVPAHAMDADAHLLNCPNGIVDLRTGDIHPHDPRHLQTKITRANYNPHARTPDWSKALSGLPDDLAHYLQVALGLAATGEAVADQVFVAVGSGGNGKSTIFGAVRHVLGSYAVSMPAKLFTAEGSTQTQLLMPLRGARMALAAESGEDHYLNMERLKALSGGDELMDRHLYSRTFATWHPSHTLFLMTNHRPRVRNSDEGTWRRLQLVPFTASYTRDGVRDVGLRDRLTEQDTNLEAVLAWVVAGAVEWLTTHRLPRSVDVDLASTEWRDDEDPVASFFREAGWEVTGTHDDTVRAATLYTAYKDHTVESGGRPFSASSWKREMERYAERRRLAGGDTFTCGRDKHGIYWRGIRLSDVAAGAFKYPGWTPPPPADEPEPAATQSGAESFGNAYTTYTDTPSEVDFPW